MLWYNKIIKEINQTKKGNKKMITTEIERTYDSIKDAQKLADKFNQFLDWYKGVDGFHTVKELREMYFKHEDTGRYHYDWTRSDASQMTHWMRKLWQADAVEVKHEWVERTFTTEGWHKAVDATEPKEIDVWDASGNKYTIVNPKYRDSEYVYGEYTKTVKSEVMYFCRKG